MKKRKRKHKTKPKPPITPTPLIVTPPSPSLSPLDVLAERRTGGAESIKGFVFQCQYATWKTLTYFTPPDRSEGKCIRLEGIEDIDIGKILTTDNHFTEFIQVKSSVNPMDAGTFWGKHRILQNFAEAYIANPNPQTRFRLVHDMPFAEGFLSRLAKACQDQKQLPQKDFEHWQEKFREFRQQQENAKKKVWDWSSFELSDFLRRITFQQTSESELLEDIRHLLISNYDIASGNEGQYLWALYCYILLWSRDKTTIRHEDVTRVIEEVREDIAKGPINPAIQNRWLVPVSFEIPKEKSYYFEGKAARPSDIAAGLPARRNAWEQKILNTFKDADVTVIRASSGQGKSTLVWQVALHLINEGWSPYELLWCEDTKEIGNIITFLESRIKIGEIPVIVIDGLRQPVSAWSELAKRTIELPVKYIVTTREEDWYRFGADRSQLRLRPVSIEMTREEAKGIFKQFKKAGQLHTTNINWQSAWERVEERGLLIEYVYLLTQGTMMEERLSHQVRTIADEKDNAAKLEILRLISVADLCGVRVPTSSLIHLIQERIGFQGDRGETLKSLEREYHIQIKNQMYVEGLHPVRSQHLSDILHETLPLVDTLINLLPLIKPDDLYEFCAHAPLMIEGKQKDLFFQKLGEYVTTQSYSEMVEALDGIFSTDAQRHWQPNKKKYDDLFRRGGLNEISILDAFPWSGISTFKNLSKINGEFGDSAKALSEAIDNIVPFDPENSDTFVFIKMLSPLLIQRELIGDLKGLSQLAQYYIRFDLKCPALSGIDETKIWQIFQTLEFKDVGEFLAICYINHSELYQEILSKHKPEIIGLLKQRTNTLTLRENDELLQIEYLLDSDKSANEQSVERVSLIRSFLPYYKEYHIRGIRPPIPGLDYYTDRYDESIKQLKPENISDPFRVHVNRIWVNRVLFNYESPSLYDWQQQWYNIRTESLAFVMETVRFFEALLEGNDKRAKSSGGKIDELRPKILHCLPTARKFPKREEEVFNSTQFKKSLDAFSKWTFPWSTFLRQMFSDDQHERHLANVNIQDTHRKLGDMQNAYDFIVSNTFPYFDVQELKEKEVIWYNRLSKTIAFYVANPSSIRNTSNVKVTVANWWDQQERNRIEGIRNVLADFEAISDFEFIAPTQTIEDKQLLKTTIGIKGLKWEQWEKEFLNIAVGLSGLADVDIDMFFVVTIEGNQTESSLALRIPKSFFERVKESLESMKEFEETEFFNPIPVPLQKEMLDVLPGISMVEIEQNIITSSIGDILVYLWRLSEIRNRLSQEEKTELEWRQELEEDCKQHLTESLNILKREATEDISSKYQKLSETAIKDNKPFTSEMFQQLFVEDLTPSNQ